MKHSELRTILGALLLSNLLADSAMSQQPWRAVTEYPSTAIPGEGLAHFAQLVGEATGVKLLMQPIYDGPDGLRSVDIPVAVQAGKFAVGECLRRRIGCA